jgi:hypothetical protein
MQNLAYSQNFEVTKFSNTSPLSKQSIIYALPRTGLKLNLAITKTIIKKGIYADYAQKYLGFDNVPKSDSVFWEITGIELIPFSEPDPEHFFALTFKTYPSNLQTLFTLDKNGILLNPSNNWLQTHSKSISDLTVSTITDPLYTEEVTQEKTDTFYKTILSDTSFIKVPVFKKQIVAKSKEDLIKETAHQLIKTRKIKLKFARGEYEYHPDAATLSIMLKEMAKQEEAYMELFIGSQTKHKQNISFTILPTKDFSQINLCSFNPQNGVSNDFSDEQKIIKILFNNIDTITPVQMVNSKTDAPNTVYYRIPKYYNISIQLNNSEIFKSRIAIYQSGSIIPLSLIIK